MAITAEQIKAAWVQLDALYVLMANSPGTPSGGALNSGVGYDSGGSFVVPGDATAAVAALGGEFASLAGVIEAGNRGHAALAINLAFVKMGNLYVDFLQDNPPILDIQKLRANGPGQSYHDNILGNLTDGASNARFPDSYGEDFEVPGFGTVDFTADVRTEAAQVFGLRTIYSGSAGAAEELRLAQSVAFDLAYGFSPEDLQLGERGIKTTVANYFVVTPTGIQNFTNEEAARDAALANGGTFVDVTDGTATRLTAGTTGTDGNDLFVAGPGNQTIDGLDGSDTYSVADNSGTGVYVNLGATPESQGVAFGGSSTGYDTLVNIENVEGGSGDDVFIGNSGDNTFYASSGSDTFDGGAGSDTFNANSASAGVNVDLVAGTAEHQDSSPGLDTTLQNVENVVGSNFDDTIVTNASDNAVATGAGNDTIHASLGNDVISGGSGSDTLQVELNSADATVAFVEGKWLLTSAGGINTELTGVERITFLDHTFHLVGGGSELTINQAVDAAGSGDTVLLSSGSHAATGQVTVDESITIKGAGEDATTIVAAATSYGVYVTASDVSISDLSVDANKVATYGIKVNPPTSPIVPTDSLTNFNLTDVTVKGAGRSEIDLNGVDNSSLTNVTADGFNAAGAETKGVGIALSDSTGITLENITTMGNEWGSIGLYSKGASWEEGTSGVTFLGSYSASEAIKLYADEEAPNLVGVSDIDFSAILGEDVWVVRNDSYRTDGRSDDFSHFFGSEADAIAFATSDVLADGVGSIVTGPVDSASVDAVQGNRFVVAEGLSIQEALDHAVDGDTIVIKAGTYAENLVIKSGVTIVTEGEVNLDPASGVAITFDGTVGDNVSIAGLNIVGGDYGIHASSNGVLAGLTLNDVDFNGIGRNAIYLSNDAVGSIAITGGVFGNNGGVGSNTEYVKLFGFTGDASFTDVTVTGGTIGEGTLPSGAFELTGVINADMNAGAPTPDMGAVTFDNVVITGDFAKVPVGINNYNNVDGLTIAGEGEDVGIDVSGATSGWAAADGGMLGVNLDGITGDMDASDYEVAGPVGGYGVTLQGEEPAQADEADAQSFVGTANNDVINGSLGDDTIDGNGGDDLVDGGAGIDTLVLEGGYLDYNVAMNGDGSITLEHKTSGDSVTFDNVEVINFVEGPAAHLVGISGSSYASIAAAITAAAEGDMVLVGGSHGDVTLNKNVDLIGAPGASIGALSFAASGDSAADRLTVEGLSVTGGVQFNGHDHLGLHNVELSGGASYVANFGSSSSDISITDAIFNIDPGKLGLRVASTADIDDLVIKNSTFNGGRFGIYFSNDGSFNTDSVSGRLENLTFNGQESITSGESRAIYAEKGSDLSLTGITVNATTSENPAGPVRGIEFNLKSGDFANLSFDDVTFTGFDAAHTGSAEYDPQLSIHMKAGATVSNVTVNDVTASQGTGASGAGAIVVDIFSEDPSTFIDGVSVTGSTVTGDVKVQTSAYDSISGNTITGNLELVVVDQPAAPEDASLAGNTVSGKIIVSDARDVTLPEGADDLILLPGFGDVDGTGNDGDNVITGNEGNNVLNGAGGIDTIDGGAGIDTAVYADISEISFDDVSGKWVVTSPTDGTETLTNVEFVQVEGGGARTLLVGGSGFATLADAIAAANPAGGDTILLSPEMHGILGASDVLVIDRAVTIKGANAGLPWDDAGRGDESVINGRLKITAEGVTIDGVSFLHDNAVGRPAQNVVEITASNTSIANSIFTSTVFGGNTGGVHDVAIMVRPLSGGIVTIEGNQFNGEGETFGKYSDAAWGRAVWVDGGAQTIIEGNTIANARTAINLENPTSADSIDGNAITNSGTGISLGNVSGTVDFISNNEFTGADTDVNANGAASDFSFDFVGEGNSATDGSYAVYSGSGADTLIGTDGNDAFFYRSADKMEEGEVVTGGAGTDGIYYSGTGETFTLSSGVSGVESVNLVGSGAADVDASAVTEGMTINGNGHANVITGTQGDDSVNAGAGVDQVNYDGGTVALVGGVWQVSGATGTDTLDGVEQVLTNGVAGSKILLVGAGGYTSIQDAIDASSDGDTILIAPRTEPYGAFEVDVPNLTITAMGEGVTVLGTFNAQHGIDPGVANSTSAFFETAPSYSGSSGTGVTVSASGVSIEGLNVAGFAVGIGFGADVSNVDLLGIDITDTVRGIRKDVGIDIDDVRIIGGSITDSYQGIIFDKGAQDHPTGPGGDATNVTIDGMVFEHLTEKGIYVETLSNSTIANITMDTVGEFGRGPAFGAGGKGEYGAGIDINLKYSGGVPYENIVIEGFTFTDVGHSAGGNPLPGDFSGAITVKVRDDASSYDADPGVYSGVLIIRNGSIDGTTTGIRAGEPGKSVGGPVLEISGVDVLNADVAEMDNVTTVAMYVALKDGGQTWEAAPTTTGNIIVVGGSGNDTVTTGGGNDIISGGLGADTLDGGAGDDQFIYASQAELDGDTVTGGEGADTVVLQSSASHNSFVLSGAIDVEDVMLQGEPGSVDATGVSNGLTITGSAGADTIQGTAFDDIIKGAGGSDTVVYDLGAGNDDVEGGEGTDKLKLVGGAAAGAVTIALSGTAAAAAAVISGAVTGQVATDSVETIELAFEGTNDKLVDASGLQSSVTVTGSLGGGDDTFQTGKGTDSVDGGAGFDTLDYSHIANGVVVNLQSGTAIGTGVGSDTGLVNFEAVRGSAHTDVLTGNGGDNTFFASGGGDTVYGGGGVNTFDASGQTSTLDVELAPLAGNAYAVGEGIGLTTLVGISNVIGGSANDTIRGSAGANVLEGGAGNDTLLGRGGDDTLIGGDDDDVLVGGAGKDHLFGGAGSDRFVFETASDSAVGANRDVIGDWDSSDKLDLSLLDANPTAAGIQGYTFLGYGSADRNVDAGELKYYRVGDNTYIVGNSGAGSEATFQIEIAGKFDLTAQNFLGVSQAVIVGNTLDNTLLGTGGDDTFRGGLGKDTLTGNGGADTFQYFSAAESAAGIKRDVITDWGNDDKFDLSALDAGPGVGTQGLTFVGYGSTSHTMNSGELKFYHTLGKTYLLGETSGDGVADFQIEIYGLQQLTAQNFIGLDHAVVTGTTAADTLFGTSGDDIFVGGLGKDTLFGGEGADTFVYRSVNESKTGALRDILADWEATDIIDLASIDANLAIAEDQAFTFVGSGSADRNVAQGELKYYQTGGNTYIVGDVDGDGYADIQIEITGGHTLTSDNFIL